MNFRKILVAIDIDENPENLADYGLELALSLDSEITFLHSIDPNLPDASSSESDVLNLNSETLQEIVAPLNYENRIPAEGVNYVVKHGLASDVIHDYAKEHDIDLIIMGLSAKVQKSGSIFSTLAIDLLNKADIPVIFIPENYRLEVIDKILFTIDFKFEEISQVLDILSFGKNIDANITGLHVVEKNEQKAVINQNLETYRRLFKYRQQKSQINFELRSGKLSEIIHDYIKNNNIDILCMMVTKQKPLSRFFNPSNAAKISKNIRIPLMIIQSGSNGQSKFPKSKTVYSNLRDDNSEPKILFI